MYVGIRLSVLWKLRGTCQSIRNGIDRWAKVYFLVSWEYFMKLFQFHLGFLLWFNLMRVEIRELRPKAVTEDNGVLVHYQSRTNVQQ